MSNLRKDGTFNHGYLSFCNAACNFGSTLMNQRSYARERNVIVLLIHGFRAALNKLKLCNPHNNTCLLRWSLRLSPDHCVPGKTCFDSHCLFPEFRQGLSLSQCWREKGVLPKKQLLRGGCHWRSLEVMGNRLRDLRWLQCWRATGDRISMEGSAQEKLLFGGPYGRPLEAREVPGMSP